MAEMKVELDEKELDYLRQIHVATALKQLTQLPGWEHFKQVVADMVTRLENQHLKFALQSSRDAYWISGVRLAAVRDFAQILNDIIDQKIDLLNQPLTNRNGNHPEGE